MNEYIVFLASGESISVKNNKLSISSGFVDISVSSADIILSNLKEAIEVGPGYGSKAIFPGSEDALSVHIGWVDEDFPYLVVKYCNRDIDLHCSIDIIFENERKSLLDMIDKFFQK